MVIANIPELLSSCIRSKIAYDPQNKISAYFPKTPITFYNTRGYLMYSNKAKALYMSFRGLSDTKDIQDALNTRPKRLMKDIYTHGGFTYQFLEFNEYMGQDIHDLIKEYDVNRLIFAGHSMGGALSAIAAAYFGHKYKEKEIHITCHTIGSPMIGNAKFVKWFTEGVDDFTRLELQDDIVPKLPIDKQFIHIPNRVKLLNNGTLNYNQKEQELLSVRDLVEVTLNKNDWRDVLINHSCERYIESLQNLSS
jgi:hypothetical protein